MDRHQAIRNTHPTVVTINGDAEAWDKDGKVVELDESLIKTEFDKLQADYDSKEYQRKRKAEYPQIEEQLDDIYHNGIDEWKKTIKAVKDKHPKG